MVLHLEIHLANLCSKECEPGKEGELGSELGGGDHSLCMEYIDSIHTFKKSIPTSCLCPISIVNPGRTGKWNVRHANERAGLLAAS